MTDILALGAVTGGINLPSTEAEIRGLGLVPGSLTTVSAARMQTIHAALSAARASLPTPRAGGSVANTADFVARAGVPCALMGLGGDDAFGRATIANCRRSGLDPLITLVPGTVTGHDVYLEDGPTRSIVLTHGANALLSPEHIDVEAIRSAKMLLLDGGILGFGPSSEAALSRCIHTAEEARVPFLLTLASASIVAGHRPFFERYASRAMMVAGNLEQTAVLLGLEPTTPLVALRPALRTTEVSALVTLDAAGAFARLDGEEELLPTEPIEALDGTGAGDNFLGAFLVARLKGLSLRRCLAVGNAVAREIIRQGPARFPPGRDLTVLLREAIRES